MQASSGTGIIIGRFQVFELNEIHLQLIEQVQAKHNRVIVFLGSNPAPSDINPLDWILRWKMFEETFGDKVEVHEMPDLPDDRIWSQELDRRILELKPEGKVSLYGTEEEFVSRYSGRHETHILEASDASLESEVLEIDEVLSHRDFRAGVIFGMLRRFPTVYPTVDIAVFSADYKKLLLARKPNETRYRFPGGFTDPSDDSFEESAMRELSEECGEFESANWTYLGSQRIEDWRYHNAIDGIITHLYACTFEGGEAIANDDIAELHWHDVSQLSEDIFVPVHQPLLPLLHAYLEEIAS